MSFEEVNKRLLQIKQDQLTREVDRIWMDFNEGNSTAGETAKVRLKIIELHLYADMREQLEIIASEKLKLR